MHFERAYVYLLDGGCAQEGSLSHASIIPFATD